MPDDLDPQPNAAESELAEDQNDVNSSEGSKTTSDAIEDRLAAIKDESESVEETAKTDTDPASMVETLTAELEEAREALTAAKDQTLRAHAEAENIRKRANRDIENARKFALENFAKELIPALDNFEIAVKSARDADLDMNIVEGFELSVKTLTDAMEKFGIRVFDPQGEVFDPEKHKAMTSIEHPDSEPGTVVEVFRRGYLIHDRLLREAEVVVAKAIDDPVDTADDAK